MSSPDKPVVLLCHPFLAHRRDLIEAQGYRAVIPEALTAADRAQVQAIICLGEGLPPAAELAAMPRLGLIACLTVGYDGVDVNWCADHGIAVTHAEGLNADDVADVAMGLLLAAWRDIGEGERMVREGRWVEGGRMAPRPSLKGRRLGVVGLGAIGQAVARRAEPFGLEVAWWGPRPKPDAPWPRAPSLLALAADSDILVVAARAEPANRGMISREVIEALGPQGALVNVARGSVVDEDVLIAALKDGRLARAGLDVFAQEPTPPARWADVPNAVLVPHIGGASSDSIPLLMAQTWENLRRHFAGEPLLSPVTRP